MTTPPDVTADPSPRREGLLVKAALALALVAYAVAGLATHHLRSDELRVAGLASTMETGKSSLAMPRLAGKPFIEKPPLAVIGVAATFRVLGESRVTARLPSILWGLLGAACLGVLAFDLYGSKTAALAAAFLLLFTGEYYWMTRRCLVDPPLLAGVIACVLFVRRGVVEPDRRWLWFPLAGVAASVAFLAKGPIGIVFPFLAFVGLLAGRRDAQAQVLKSPWLWSAALILALPIGLWLWALYAEGGTAALKVVVVDNGLRRFFPAKGYHGGHRQPIYYYLDKLPLALLPTLLLAPAFLRWHWRDREERAKRDALWLTAGWLGLGFLVLSLAGTKRTLYLGPLLAPAALLAGGWVASLLDGEERQLEPVERWTLLGLCGLTVLGALALTIAMFPLSEGGPPAWCVVAAGLAAAGAALTVRAWRAGRRAELMTLALAANAVVAGSLLSLVLVRKDDEEALPRAFYQEVDRLVPSDVRIVVFPAHEATLGALAFYVHRIPRFENDLEQARAELLAPGGSGYLLVADKEYDDLTPVARQLRDADPRVTVLAHGQYGRWSTTLLARRPRGSK